MNQIADQLDLGPDVHLLEIGTGWGGLSIHLARNSGCRITTTTISREQAALARERVAAAGLSDRIEVVEIDYRDLTGKLRPPGLDRDDRGGRLAGFPDLLPQVLGAAQAGRVDAAPGDHDR